LRYCHGFQSSRSAASSASPISGAPSSPTPSTAGGSPRPLPAYSTAPRTTRASPKKLGISSMSRRLGFRL
jgi:hypothetical protein